MEYERINPKDYVWYASYGSNILQERFALYQRDALKKYDAVIEVYDSAPFMFSHPVFFGDKSSRWGYKGVAFLDTAATGIAFGWRYLIRREDLKYIRCLEGKNWYGNEFFCGTDEHGIDIVTLTCPEEHHHEKNLPHDDYMTIIAKGLRDRYGMGDPELNEYFGSICKFVPHFDFREENIQRILNDL